MGIYFNAYCEDLNDFRITSEETCITIHAEQLTDRDMQSIMFSATNGIDRSQLILEISTEGICYFTPCISGTVSEVYSTAHYDYGFYHYAYEGKRAQCTYNDFTMVTIEVENSRLYVRAKLPSKLTRGIVVTEFNFKELSHQLLLCFAKLCGSYAFSQTECSVLDAVCPKIKQTVPKLSDFQLEMLKKEYAAAYDIYMSGEDIEDVMPMLLHVVSKYGS